VEHEFFAYNAYEHEVEVAGGPWFPLIIGLRIRFDRIEEIIDKVMENSASSSSSIHLYLRGLAPKNTLWLGQFYLIDMGSVDRMEESIHRLGGLYCKYLEPLRVLMRSEKCFDDPFFFPEQDYGFLHWELRRAAYYSDALDAESFALYVSDLKKRISDYSEGLGDDVGLAAKTARKFIDNLRIFISAAEKSNSILKRNL
jgi:hypothetical protein